MLEVKNLSKIYKTKGGEDVKALDDVSLCFPETGMVFLLGKSGSGKSTLLNVCGGLDSPSGGEIIVKGRSSKDFTQSDFDSYRNTFVGFIFQEYNILNEFSVEDNIALALDLQGKPKDKERISKLLEDVDLLGYAKRKPNTLSGGQKQRIAIARALIKSPEIIMADEPTGALDSATGKQVLETLKKLSKDRLVIIVSHDRDFAEQYGDRIIELKDGKILSDVTKTQEEQKSLSSNVTAIGDTLCIKQGSALDENDFEQIKAFLSKADTDVLIASGQKDVKAFKKVSRITDDGEKEVFRDTDETSVPQKAYSAEESKFIRSKLPLRHAMKIGASSLKTKPLRLLFTILLCTIAFTLFGLLSTLTFYDSLSTLRQTLTDSDLEMVRIGKQYQIHSKYYENGELTSEHSYANDARFNESEVLKFAEQFGSDTFGATRIDGNFSVQTNSKYYLNTVNYLAYLPESNTLRSKITVGRYPTAKNEICISSYMAETMYACKAFDASGNAMDLNSANDLINKEVIINGTKFKIVGIIESNELPEKYNSLKESSDSYQLEYDFQNELRDSIHTIGFVTQDTLTEYANSLSYGNDLDAIFRNHDLTLASVYNENGELTFPENPWSDSRYAGFSRSPYSMSFFDDTQSVLYEGEVIIPASLMLDKIRNKFDITYNNAYQTYEQLRNGSVYNDRVYYYETTIEAITEQYGWGWEIRSAWEENALYGNHADRIPTQGDELYSLYTQWQQDFASIAEAYQTVIDIENKRILIEKVISNGYWYYPENGESEFIELTPSERQDCLKQIVEYYLAEDFPITVKARLFNNENGGFAYGDVLVYNAVGYYDTNDYPHNLILADSEAGRLWEIQSANLRYYSSEETSYVAPEDAVYNAVFAPYDHSDTITDSLIAIYTAQTEFDETDVRIRLDNGLISGFESVDMMIEQLSKIFLYISLVLAVFSALLLSNFISVSISQKRKEIGILRAVGARSFDVFKIFFSESFVISAICVVLSVLGSIAGCILLNLETSSMIGASLFVFGVTSAAILIGVALITAVVATFLPVYNAAKKKPVESIRAL